MSAAPTPDDRFRRLFHALDADAVWSDLLPARQLSLVRAAAASAETWAAFLSGGAAPRRAAAPLPVSSPSSSPPPPTPLSSPRKRSPERDHPRRPALSALVRRTLAVASVHDQFFHNVPGALPRDDHRYEIDQGLLPGDDGGYATFDQLQQEETASSASRTSPYVLLGNDHDLPTAPADCMSPDDPLNAAPQNKDRSARLASTPKRPRRTTAFGLSEQMESFIRHLRELCEPHRDAAQEESAQKKDVPKNIHRKAVSAASVVEELKEMEHKAHIGKYERVEECISAVSACIGNQDETFAQVLTQIEDRADALREEYRVRKERFGAMVRVKELTTGILGCDADLLESTDEDEQDEEDDMPDKEDDTSHPPDRWTPPRRGPHIPFMESELQCWPSGDDMPLPDVHPDRPRVPVFERESSKLATEAEGNIREVQPQHDNLVTVIGADNLVMKNVFSMHRALKLREHAFSSLAVLSKKRSAMRMANRPPSQKTESSPTKMEDVLPSSTSLNSKPQTLSRSAPKDAPSEADGREFEIKNDPFDAGDSVENGSHQEPRERALGRAVIALMFAHEGFTHASSLALEILVDVLERFVERIGYSLISCRENIDQQHQQQPDGEGVALRNPSEDEIFEELRIISSSGFRGRYPELECYAKHDLPRCEQALREAEIRLRAQLSRIHQELVNTETRQGGSALSTVPDVESQKSTAEEEPAETSSPVDGAGDDVRLDDTAFTFGYLSNCVSLDVLGPIKVPRKLAYDHVSKPTRVPVPVSLTINAEKKRDDDQVAPDPVAVKAEVSKMDIGS